MGYTITLPEIIRILRAQRTSPWQVGHSIGLMLYHIFPLTSTHLDNDIDFSNPIPRALAHFPSFIGAVDSHIAYLRFTSGCSEKSFSSTSSDRKAKAKRCKHIDHYTHLVEAAFKACVCEGLGDVFDKWGKEEIASFNKGVDKALSGVQWVKYPSENVVYEAGEGDWEAWLRGKCEELGMEGARRGERVLEDI
ncbi:hypothetical protein IQ06DRAFT_255817, partial [Phaeosphaeriaceae sp. SRC1lsM3a]